MRPALVSFLALTGLAGLGYPLVVSGLAWTFFPGKAGGSLLVKDGRPLGSALIGQAFSSPGEFWGRPSATTNPEGRSSPYDAASSGGSSLAPGNPALRALAAARAAALIAADPGHRDGVPVDLVTASGSGLDPHISPAGAAYQVPRVARARGLPQRQVLALVARHTEGAQLGLLGAPRVNILRLNLALDELKP